MALRLPCSGLAPLRLSRGPACGPRTPAARTAGAIFFGGSSLAAPQTPLPSVFHGWGAAALGWGWHLGWIFGAFFLLFSVRLAPFFLPAVALAVRFCFLVVCVVGSSGCWSGLLCFPSGSVLWAFVGSRGGVRLWFRGGFLPLFYLRIGLFYRRLGGFCLHIVGLFLAYVKYFSYLCGIIKRLGYG